MAAVADLLAAGRRRRAHPRQRPPGRQPAGQERARRGRRPAGAAGLVRRPDPGHARLRADERARRRARRARRRPAYAPPWSPAPWSTPTTPASPRPTKPIGRFLPAEEAALLVEHGETWEDRGEKGWRRVVASPEPLEILDAAGRAGAGRRPASSCRQRRRRDPRRPRATTARCAGVEAVIDKDLGAALLARTVDGRRARHRAPTSPNAVLRYGTPEAEPIGTGHRRASCARYAADGHFASGSMGPKVDAACRFVEQGGTRAVITDLDHIADAVAGRRRHRRRTRLTHERNAHAQRHRSTQGPDPLRRRRQRAREAHRRRGDGGRPGDRDHRQDRGQRRRQRLHPDHRRPGVPRGARREGRARRRRSSRSRSCGPAAPTA